MLLFHIRDEQTLPPMSMRYCYCYHRLLALTWTFDITHIYIKWQLKYSGSIQIANIYIFWPWQRYYIELSFHNNPMTRLKSKLLLVIVLDTEDFTA